MSIQPDRFTKIANDLLDQLIRIRIPGEAMQVFLFIMRKTYGFNKKTDKISLSQFVGATGLNKPAVCRAILKLRSMGLIFIKKDNTIIEKDNSGLTEYGVNKVCEIWQPLSKKITLSKKIIGVIEKDNLPLSKKIPTKDTLTKDTITKETPAKKLPDNSESDFEEIWKLYPNKKGRFTALKYYRARLKEGATKEEFTKAVKNYVIEVKGRELKHIKHGSTFFNQDWRDYLTLQPENNIDDDDGYAPPPPDVLMQIEIDSLKEEEYCRIRKAQVKAARENGQVLTDNI